MEVERIAEGLWRWTARHPDWEPGEDWDEEVACVYYEADDAIVLVDPLVPTQKDERERFLVALDRDVERAGRPLAVVLTIFWHERSAAELAERYRGSIWLHAPAVPELDAEVTHPFAAGDPLPGGLQAIEAHRRNEVVLWIPTHRALVVGDALLGDGRGGIRLPPNDWYEDEMTTEEYREKLRPLLELPVERVLVAHGDPVLAEGRAALRRALGGAP